jgi:hypothetical protein
MRVKNRRLFPQKCRKLKAKKRLNLPSYKLISLYHRKVTVTKLTILLLKTKRSLVDATKSSTKNKARIVKTQMISLAMIAVKICTRKVCTKFKLKTTINTSIVLVSGNHKTEKFKVNLNLLNVRCQGRCQKAKTLFRRKLNFKIFLQTNFLKFSPYK